MYLLFVILIYLLLRLPNLTLQPIFCDEATYLDWGWRMVTGGVPFHSLYDAKQPLLMWIFGFAEKFIADPLLAGRLVSVFTGLLTLLGIYVLTSYVFDEKIALISCCIYPLIPLFLLFDRQALMESAVSAFGVWSVYSLLLLIDRPSLKQALFFGTVSAIGFWIKSSSLIFIVTDLLVYLVLISRRPNRIWYFNLLIIAVSTAVILLMPLFIQPQFWSLYLKYNSQYSLGLVEMLRLPFSHWWTTFIANLDIMFFQLTPSLLFLVIPGIFLSLKYRSPHKYIFIFLFLFPLIMQTLSVKFTIARYLVSFLPLTVVYTAIVLSRIPLLAVSMALPFGLTVLQIFSPSDYFIFLHRFTNYSYYEPYVCCYSTGYPVNQAVDYLKKLSVKEPLYIGVYLGVGNPPSAILSYFRSDPRVIPLYLDKQLMGNYLDGIDCLTSKTPVYFLAIQEQQAGLNKYFLPVTVFTNPYGRDDYLTLYTLKKDCSGKSLDISLNLQR